MGCTSYKKVEVSENTVTDWTCIYKTENRLVSGTANSSGSNKPEACSNPDWKCSVHGKFDNCQSNKNIEDKCNALTKVQDECIGHKLTVSNTRGQSFPVFNEYLIGKVVTPEEYNKLVEILKWQIEERKASSKYAKYYNSADVKKAFQQLSSAPYYKDIDPERKEETTKLLRKISYTNELLKLINCIQKLQSQTVHDTAGKQTIKLDSKTRGTKQTLYPKVSITNMQTLKNAILKDVQDCICYADCNTYSVCYCYGNCNHY